MLVLAVAFLVLLVPVARAALAWLRLYRMMARLPGPPGLPVLGNSLTVWRHRGSVYDLLWELCAKYSSVARVWITAALPLVLLAEPDDIKAVLSNPAFVDKPQIIYNAMKAMWGPGLVFHRRRVWKPIRTAVANSLNKNALSSFTPVFWASSAECAAKFEEIADEGAVANASLLCGSAAHFSVMKTILSSSTSDVPCEDKKLYVRFLQQSNDMVLRRILRPWLLIDWIFSLTKDSKRYSRWSKFTADFVKRVVANKREVHLREKIGAKRPDSGRKSFLDHMISGDMPLNMDLESEARFLMVAGSGSTMEALSFIYYTLSIRQDWQERVHKELQEVFGGDALRPVEDDDLPHLELTERVIKETLRFFPVVPVFFRDVHQDLRLPSGYTLPRGCIASFFLPALHRDPRWFERPDEFDPDRFLPERSRDRHPYAFIPFSAGPRNCVALRYAMAFLKTHVATVLRRVQLLPAPGAPSCVQDVRVKMVLTLGVRGGANVIVKRRPDES